MVQNFLESGGGTTPTGTINITQNGVFDVSSYASADVNVSGGGVPETYSEFINLVEEFFDNSIVPNTTRYTQNNITLYTPSADYKKYYIRKRFDNNMYSIVWYSNTLYGNARTTTLDKSSNATSAVRLFVYSHDVGDKTNSIQKTTTSGSTNIPAYYYSGNYNTLQEAINAIQSASTTYTTWAGDTITDDANYEGYSNLPFYLKSDNSGIGGYKMYGLPRLSDNETIEVIT